MSGKLQTRAMLLERDRLARFLSQVSYAVTKYTGRQG